MRFQLRVYAVRPGAADSFVAEWHERIRPLRLLHGFSILGPWLEDDGETFVWIAGHDGDFEAADSAYRTELERASLDPDPARHVVAVDTRLMRAPVRAPAPGR